LGIAELRHDDRSHGLHVHPLQGVVDMALRSKSKRAHLRCELPEAVSDKGPRSDAPVFNPVLSSADGKEAAQLLQKSAFFFRGGRRSRFPRPLGIGRVCTTTIAAG